MPNSRGAAASSVKVRGSHSVRNPEATGGKGTVAELRFGARMLAALLAQEPVAGLGGALVPTSVAFQADSPVDDVVVTAQSGQTVVTWHVAGRMTPRLSRSSTDTVSLFARFLTVLAADRTAASKGRVRLGLAVVAPHGPSTVLARLCRLAGQPSAAMRAAVKSGAEPFRTRLAHVDGLIEAAADELGWTAAQVAKCDWTWLLLRALTVVQTSLEDGGADAVAMTSQLMRLVDGDVERAGALRVHLHDIAGDCAASGLKLTLGDLELQLHGRVTLGAAHEEALRAEMLQGRDADALRVVVTGQMDGTLDAERRTAAEAINEFDGHRAFLWEDDRPGQRHDPAEAVAVASSSDGIVVLVGSRVSRTAQAEYAAAQAGGAAGHILIRDTDLQDPPAARFVRESEVHNTTTTRRFANLPELRSHLYESLNRAMVRRHRLHSLAVRTSPAVGSARP